MLRNLELIEGFHFSIILEEGLCGQLYYFLLLERLLVQLLSFFFLSWHLYFIKDKNYF